MNQEQAAPTPVADTGSRNLVMRAATALVLAPLAIGIAYAGGWAWAVLATAVAVGLYIEWLSVVGAVGDKRVVAAGSVALALGGGALALGQGALCVFLIVAGLVAVAALNAERRGWSVLGYGYAAAALIASVLVRLDPNEGFAALILVLLVVWVTDIGGYFAGRGIGGPKLWPRVSPKKTWAGALGGFFGSLIVASGFAALGYGKWLPLLALAALLSVVSQLGDLFESAVKRRFGVKDSSHIIPGHGGLLDRLDGYVAAIVVAALFGVMRGALDGAGRGLMVW
ncbi:phosphatidate cytidylyltransferase [Rhodopseudomonas palustris]|uniref:Phosphatidate cytidylyltransferase n=1 Tax=Rhodopseudomonas palustris (strain BisB18) TaxID=316056 RepID=Q215E4_RHOPB